ncbi:unnamed protein product [Rotaria magnacalcarata]
MISTTYQHRDMSLSDLPVEIVYRILDHLNTDSILISVRRVCKKLYSITDTYNRYELDLSSIPQAAIKLIASNIRSENVIRLVLSGKSFEGSIFGLFSPLFDIHDFYQLRSLDLNSITCFDLDYVLKAFTSCPLSSLSIDVHYRGSWDDTIKVLVESSIVQNKLRKLILKNVDDLMKQISWPNNCNLTYLSLGKCTYSVYQIILGNLRYLKTLVIRNCIIRDHNQTIPTSYSQLISLTISYCDLSMSDIEFLLARTPSLTYLKLCCRQRLFDSAFNGFSWEQFIKINISSLAKFEFFFSYAFENNSTMFNIDYLVDSFRTSFWLNEKRWFIICDYFIQRKAINLYTTPMCISRSEDLSKSLSKSSATLVTIRWTVSPIDVSCLPILIWTDGMFGINETEMLTKIELPSIRIDDNEAKYFGDAMKTNKKIAQVVLRDNKIGVVGSKNLAAGLRYNTTLRTLSLVENEIGDEGAQYTADLLQNSTVL